MSAMSAAAASHAASGPDQQPPEQRAARLEMVYKGDLLGVAGGGVDRTVVYMGNVDLKLELDGERAFEWSGSHFFVYVLNDHGGELNPTVQSVQGVDNIEVRNSATRLYEAWGEQSFAADRASLRVGLYDLNSEFYVTPSSGVFINPSFGTGPELGQTGKNGPSIFPVTSLGARLNIEPSDSTYAQLVILDAVPGDPAHPKGTHVKLSSEEGALWVVEGGWTPSAIGASPGKLALGAWGYTRSVNDLTRTDAMGRPEQVRNQGAYLLLDQPLYRHPGAGERGLDVFFRSGIGEPHANQVSQAWQLGAIHTGPLASRADDVAGLGVTYAHIGGPFRDAAIASGVAPPRDEWIVELTYRLQLTRHTALQPDLQYVHRSDAGIGHVLVLGLRGELAFEK
jgi:porin